MKDFKQRKVLRRQGLKQGKALGIQDVKEEKFWRRSV